jgi:uncharacterized membrane protein
MTNKDEYRKNNLARLLFAASIVLFGAYDAATTLVAADYMKSQGYEPFAAETSNILSAVGAAFGPAGFVAVKLGVVIAVFWIILWLVERSPWMNYSYKALYAGSSLAGIMAGTSNLLGVRASIQAGYPKDAIVINGDPMLFLTIIYAVLGGLVALGIVVDLLALLLNYVRPREEHVREMAPAQDVSQPPIPVTDYERFLNAKTNIHKGDNL